MINRPRTDAGRLALVFYDAKPRTPQSRASGRELIAAMADHILATEAELDAEHAATVERLRQRDAQSEPDDYWTGWNDALDKVLALKESQP